MKVLVAGDFCPRHRVNECFEHSDYQTVLGDVKESIREVDYSIVNFECPIRRAEEKPIQKSGPNLYCSSKGMYALKWAGFQCVTLANNHFLDYGEEGVKNTLEECKHLGIDVVGAGESLKESSKTLYRKIGGKTLGIINCCEHEFSIATEHHGGSNALNPIKQYYAINEAKSNSDYVLMVVHGGHEHFQYPSERMIETYRFFIDAGADAVVNHHQHCFSGYEIYEGKPIFYGLGNFCFDNNKKESTIWNLGFMVKLEFANDIRFDILPYEQCALLPKVRLLERNALDKNICEINDAISDKKMLRKIIDDYYDKSQYNIKVGLLPISNKVVRSLLFRRIIHPLLPKKWMLRLENYSMCESHRDKLKFLFDNNK